MPIKLHTKIRPSREGRPDGYRNKILLLLHTPRCGGLPLGKEVKKKAQQEAAPGGCDGIFPCRGCMRHIYFKIGDSQKHVNPTPIWTVVIRKQILLQLFCDTMIVPVF